MAIIFQIVYQDITKYKYCQNQENYSSNCWKQPHQVTLFELNEYWKKVIPFFFFIITF